MEIQKKRDYVFDNLKGVLVLLVVFGHVILSYSKKNLDSVVTDVFMYIYLFHMPFFVFISGYFSKKHNVRKITELIVLYVFCQVIFYPLATALVNEKSYFDYQKTIFVPQKSYWYMLALAAWRIVTPYVTRIKWFLPISFIFGITIGYALGNVNLNFLSIGRVVSFYPFFLLGYVTDKEFLDKLKRKIPAIIPILLIIGISIFTYFYIKLIAANNIKPINIYQITYGVNRYSTYLTNPQLGWIFKSILYAIQVVFIYSVVTISKNKKTIFTKIGNVSLIIYVTHVVFLKFYEVRLFKRFKVQDADRMIFLIISFAVSLLFCYVCTLKPINQIGTFILNLPSKIIKREE